MNPTLVLQNVLDNLASWPLLLPEVLVAITLGVILVLVFLPPRHQRYWLCPVALVGTTLAWYSKYWLGSHLELRPGLPLFNQLLVLDPLAVFLLAPTQHYPILSTPLPSPSTLALTHSL